MHHVEHRHQHAVISFVSEVSERSIIELVHQLTDLRYNHFYRNVHLQIASPGGEVHALFYFLDALEEWQRDGLNVTTRALTSCSSAAAVLLSLGHKREASRSSRMLYHDARYPKFENLTRRSAENTLSTLGQTDDIVLSALAERAALHSVGTSLGEELTTDDLRVLEFIRGTYRDEQSETEWDEFRWIREWLKKTKNETGCGWRTKRWRRLYDALFLHDRAISGTLAFVLGLVDDLREPGRHEKSASSRPDENFIEIPEWGTFHPEGRVAMNHLRRHTLILGETGSGKSASGVIPAVAAAYRSSEVAAALVIDPKRELLRVLEDMENAFCSNTDCTEGTKDTRGKKIVLLRPEESAFNLMSGSWSIEGLIAEERYLSSAREILKRTAGLVPTPARVLLHKPGTSHEDFFDQEGVRLASAVLAIVIECTNGDSPIFVGDRPEGIIWQLWEQRNLPEVVVEHRTNAASALRDVGILLGMVTADPEIQELIDRARELGRKVKEYEEGNPDPEGQYWGGSRSKASLSRCAIVIQLLTDLTTRFEAEETAAESRSNSLTKYHDFLYRLTRREAQTVFEIELGVERNQINPDDPYPPLRRREDLTEPQDWAHMEPPGWTQMSEVDERNTDSDLPTLSDEMVMRPERCLVHDWLVYILKEIVETPIGSRNFSLDTLMDDFNKTWKDEQKDGQQHSIHALMVLWQLASSEILFTDTWFRIMITRIRAVLLDYQTASPGASPGDDINQNVFSASRLFLEQLCGLDEEAEATEDKRGSALGEMAKVWQRRKGTELKRIGNILEYFAMLRKTAPRHYAGVLPTAMNIIEPFANDDVNRTIYFGCEPALGVGKVASKRRHIDFGLAVGDRKLREYPGEIFVFQPESADQSNVVGKVCKALYFEAILADEDRTREGTKMRLVGYIADEFQRFVTADRMHGEQSFLDTCRSFGAFAVLATQSMAGLEYALCDLEADGPKRASALKIMLNNTGTKIFFRSTDLDTAHLVWSICPEGRDGRKVVGLRPLSTLSVGECYAALPDGRFERVQLSPSKFGVLDA